MLIVRIFGMAFESLKSNKLQSFLAMLGIIIGVGSVISIYCLGESLRSYIIVKVEAMVGANAIMVMPGHKYKDGLRTGRYDNLTEADARAVLNELDEATSLSPIIWARGQVKFQNRNCRTSIEGVATSFFQMGESKLGRGRVFTNQEVKQGTKVAIIGQGIAEELFTFEEALGKTIRINGTGFKVIGILKKTKIFKKEIQNYRMIMPYTTVIKKFTGSKTLPAFQLGLKSEVSPTVVKPKLRQILRRRHRLTAQTKDDFLIRSTEEQFKDLNKIVYALTAVLGGIAAISLLVGGIGIMNIMLITVSERIREIGIRKAIGARDSDILTQFLIEAAALSLTGGLIGTFGALTLLKCVGYYFSIPLAGIFSAILISVSFSSMVGIFFGYWPAKRAAKLDPIECLRHE